MSSGLWLVEEKKCVENHYEQGVFPLTGIKVFVVFRGEYEERVIDAVFPTREAAEYYIDHDSDDELHEYDIEEHIIGDRLPNMEMRWWKIELDAKDGSGDRVRYFDKYLPEKGVEAAVRYHRGYNTMGTMCFYVVANSKSGALSMAKYLYQEVLANEQEKFPHLRHAITTKNPPYGENRCPLYCIDTGEILLTEGEYFHRVVYVGNDDTRDESSLSLPEGIKWRRIE